MKAQHALRMVFWICPLLLQPLIALAMLVRGQVKNFPFFFSYTLFVSGRDLILLLFKGNMRLYSWIYWLGEPLTVILGLVAINEVLSYLLRPYSTLRTLGIRLFWISLVCGMAVSMVLLKISPFSSMAASTESARLLQRSAWFVEAGVLIALILFISQLGITWKHYAAGIVAGFGISAGLQLALVELESLRAISVNIFVLLKSAAYTCAVLVWTIYFVQRPPTMHVPKSLPESDLARWDDILRRYLRR